MKYNIIMVHAKSGDAREVRYITPAQVWVILPAFLNGDMIPTSQRRASQGPRRRVLGMLTKFKELAAAYRDSSGTKNVSKTRALEVGVNVMLSRYPLRYVVDCPAIEGASIRIAPQFIKKTVKPLKETEREAVAVIVDLARTGMLDHIKLCDWSGCKRWFIATRSDKRFCSDSCKRKFQQSSSEFKEQRAAYMRERYAKIKARDEGRER